MQLWVDDCANKLTKQEITARDIMVNTFNPVLKFLLAQSKLEEWIKYGCNSCRQTAIFGAIYLKDLLPDYEIIPYEGVFTEPVNDNSNEVEEYIHCFIIASKNDRHLIIDLSRTSKHLLFNVIEDVNYPYPKTGDYKHVKYFYRKPIDLIENYYNCTFEEYFTNMNPKKVIELIKCIINNINPIVLANLKNYVYTQFTAIDT